MKKSFSYYSRIFNNIKLNFKVCSLAAVGGMGFAVYTRPDISFYLPGFVSATAATLNKTPDVIKTEKGSREDRFLEFASVQCKNVIYMTPADFLESVTQNEPRYRTSRHTISEKELKKIVDNTPSRRYGSKDLFRSIDKEGVISYTEYLFLLCVLTKPISGFKIAFNMFDTDMNEEVDKKEFLVSLKVILSKHAKMERTMQHKKAEVAEKLLSETDASKISEEWFLLKLLNKLIVGFANPLESSKEDDDYDEEAEKFQNLVETEIDTTMLVHFFGRSGRDKLRFKDFSKFMENLQTEVLEIEFSEYSKGLKTISESEFARILLRHTKIDKQKYDTYIKRVIKNIKRETGITFEDFKAFFQFLNNLDDFILAMKMYTLADRPISQQEFHQAVKACTNMSLSPQLIETLFYLFDEDGDGHLSYQEFVKVMKNRMNRGFSSLSSNRTVWNKFRRCVSDETYSS